MRGNYLAPGDEVGPGIPVVLDDPDHPVVFDDPQKHPEWNSTGRRLTLAKWLVSPENPLVARVFVGTGSGSFTLAMALSVRLTILARKAPRPPIPNCWTIWR